MFTFADIRDIAIQIERNGEAVYRRTAKNAQDLNVARMLEWLAEEEARHAQWFESLPLLRAFEPQDDQIHNLGRELLQGMMAQQTFSLDPARLSDASEINALLRDAIEFENDTILFYEMLYSFLDDSQTMHQLEQIIAEEGAHVAQLKEIIALRGD